MAFVLLIENLGDGVPQFDQHLDIQGGVIEPVGGQRTYGPVGRTVSLGQAEAQQPLHHRRKVDPVEAGQAAGQFGVVEGGRAQTHFGQARQILVRGVQNPFVGPEHFGQRSQHIEWAAAVVHRVDQHRSGPVTSDLDQIRPVGVAESGRAFGVDGERTAARRQFLGGSCDLPGGDRDRRHTFGRTAQRDRFGLRRRRGALVRRRNGIGPDVGVVAHLRRVTGC